MLKTKKKKVGALPISLKSLSVENFNGIKKNKAGRPAGRCPMGIPDWGEWFWKNFLSTSCSYWFKTGSVSFL